MKNTLSLSVLLAICAATTHAQDTLLTGRLIGVKVADQGLSKNVTYQYGKADGLDVWAVLPVVAQHGTAVQRRRAKTLMNYSDVFGILFGAGTLSLMTPGFFAPPMLDTRRIVAISGFGLFTVGLVAVPIQNGLARRLVRSYNDALLNQKSAYFRDFADRPYLTLADTVHLSGKTYSYRGLPGVLPNRTPGFEWPSSKPRLNALDIVSSGLIFVGTLTMTLTSLYALGPGDYRRYAWAGLGLTLGGAGLSFIGRRKVINERLETIRRYNQFVRERP